MVALRRQLWLLCLLLLLPAVAQARLTLGWVPGAAILGSEDQARRLAAHLEARLAEPVVLRSCADEAQLHDWLHRYRMVDLAPISQDYLRRVPAGQLLPLADLNSENRQAQLVLRQGLRGDQQLQLRTLLTNLSEEPAGRDLLAAVGGLRLTPPAGAPRATLAAVFAGPASPKRTTAAEVSWPDQRPAPPPVPDELLTVEASKPVPPAAPLLPEPVSAETIASPETVSATVAQPVAPAPSVVSEPVTGAEPTITALPVPPTATEPVAGVGQMAPPEALPLPEPVLAAAPTPAVVSEPETVAAVEPPAASPVTAPKAALDPPAPKDPPKLAALPPKSPVPPLEVAEQTVSRSLSSGRQPLADGAPLQTIYLVPFTTIMVPLPVAEAVFDQFVETLNENGAATGYEFVILKDDLERVDPIWLRKATYVTGEIFGYVEESGCCSTDIRSKSRLALYRPGSSEPKLRHEYPAKAFFDHDYSTIDVERKKLAQRISLDLSSQLLKALGGG